MGKLRVMHLSLMLAVSAEMGSMSSEDFKIPSESILTGRLNNSAYLNRLETQLVHLSETQRADVFRLINSHPSLFSDTPSRTHLIKHDIDVGDAKPIKQHFYCVPVEKRKRMEKEVAYMLENDIAEPASSNWASPCLLAGKSDGSDRFCKDFRKVNSVTKPDCYPLPRMEDCIDEVAGAKFVTKLDLLKGYWQVPLTARAREISAFITSSGLFSYSVMPFGLRNAPATFQRLMNKVLSGLTGCAAYLDDVVLYSDTWVDHVRHLEALLDQLVHANLTVNLAKCEFAKATVTYLGRVVGQGVVRPVQAKVDAIDKYPAPTSKKELMRFLGLVGYYRSFCPNFSTVVAPLTNLLSKKVSYVWSPQCQMAFVAVKDLLCNTPVLAAPNFDKPFKIQVDASGVGAGAVLLQEGEQGVEHPVCFSRKFGRHQLNYSVVEKETLALIWSLQYFEVYVGAGSVPVTIYTDHNPLTFLSSMQNSNQRLMRWLFLQPYHFDVCHIKGRDNVMADALSRALA